MRNSFTDSVGTQLTSAFKKSGMSVQDFIGHIAKTRASIFMGTSKDGFFVAVDEGILHCYHTAGKWYAKL